MEKYKYFEKELTSKEIAFIILNEKSFPNPFLIDFGYYKNYWLEKSDKYSEIKKYVETMENDADKLLSGKNPIYYKLITDERIKHSAYSRKIIALLKLLVYKTPIYSFDDISDLIDKIHCGYILLKNSNLDKDIIKLYCRFIINAVLRVKLSAFDIIDSIYLLHINRNIGKLIYSYITSFESIFEFDHEVIDDKIEYSKHQLYALLEDEDIIYKLFDIIDSAYGISIKPRKHNKVGFLQYIHDIIFNDHFPISNVSSYLDDFLNKQDISTGNGKKIYTSSTVYCNYYGTIISGNNIFNNSRSFIDHIKWLLIKLNSLHSDYIAEEYFQLKGDSCFIDFRLSYDMLSYLKYNDWQLVKVLYDDGFTKYVGKNKDIRYLFFTLDNEKDMIYGINIEDNGGKNMIKIKIDQPENTSIDFSLEELQEVYDGE